MKKLMRQFIGMVMGQIGTVARRAIGQLGGAIMKPVGWVVRNPLGSLLVLITLGVVLWMLVETARQDNLGFSDKSLWDWLDLLIVSAVVAGGVFLLNQSARQGERRAADDREKQQTLRDYLDKMSDLLLHKHLGITVSQIGESEGEDANLEPATIVARARTVSVLRYLDTNRAATVLRFLGDAGIQERVLRDTDTLFVDFSSSDLTHASLRGAYLRGAILREANLEGADLREADLREAVLRGANLKGADLREAEMYNAQLFRADLLSAKLQRAKLERADLRSASLFGADLQSAFLRVADLRTADLRTADLGGALLFGADLTGAKMGGFLPDEGFTNLKRAHLEGANLSYTDLGRALLAGVIYNAKTIWPRGFDPVAAGAEEVS